MSSLPNVSIPPSPYSPIPWISLIAEATDHGPQGLEDEIVLKKVAIDDDWLKGTAADGDDSRNSQYHHFVPQFIIKNFSDYAERLMHVKYPGGGARRRDNAKVGSSVLMLEVREGEISRRHARRVFGITNMYKMRDQWTCGEAYVVEKQLSTMEYEASVIIAQIQRDNSPRYRSIHLAPIDECKLRQFIIVMHYRSKSSFDSCLRSMGRYRGNQQDHLLRHVKDDDIIWEKDFWLHNLQALLNVDVSVAKAVWADKLRKMATPAVAEWFINSFDRALLAFSVPEASEDEFLLADDAYSAHGRYSESLHWINSYIFALIGPKLMLALGPPTRWALPAENSLETTESLNVALRLNSLDTHIALTQDYSDKPMIVDYSELWDLDQQSDPHPLLGKMPVELPIVHLTSREVQEINSVALDKFQNTTAIVFESHTALLKALEYYLRFDHPDLKVIREPYQLREKIKSSPTFMESDELRSYLWHIKYLVSL